MFVFFLLTRPRPSGSWRTDETKKMFRWRVGHLYSRRRENAHPSINNIQVKTKVATSIAHHFFPLTNWQLLIIVAYASKIHTRTCVLFVSSFSRVEFTWENGSRETVTFFHVGRSIRVESSRWWKFVFFFALSRRFIDWRCTQLKKFDDYKFRTRGFFVPCASFNSPSESLTP